MLAEGALRSADTSTTLLYHKCLVKRRLGSDVTCPQPGRPPLGASNGALQGAGGAIDQQHADTTKHLT